MPSSVRARLTIWHAAAVAAVLLILAVATYAFLRVESIRRVDSSLEDVANAFLATVHAELHDAHETETFQDCVAAAIQEHTYRETTFSVFDAQGAPILSSPVSPVLLESEVHRYNDLRDRVTSNSSQGKPFRTLVASGHLYRGYSRSFTAEGKTYVVVALQSMHREQEFMEALGRTYALVIPLAVLLAGLGGYFLARRSLLPVAAMSSQAEQINAKKLDERLIVENKSDELGRLAASFNRLLDRLDQSFQLQRRFVADASHELRTPVAILSGEAEVALSRQDRSPEEYRESLAILHKEALRLKKIIEDLFTLTRADIGQLPLSRSDFYLDELVADCARSCRTLVQAKRITLQCNTTSELPIHADEVLVRRMLMNLLDNGIKYTPTGGSVAIAVERSGDRYLIAVTDTGPGIPQELQHRVFERFFRAEKARTSSDAANGGAGLGLAICRWIAEAHQGTLELTSSGATGSTFTISLPAPSSSR